MANFWGLLLNENMKIYRRLRTWIMLAVLVLIPIAMTLILYYTSSATDSEASHWGAMMIETQVMFIFTTIFTVVCSAEAVAGEFTWGTIKLLLIRPWSRSTILLAKYVAMIQFALFFTVVMFIVSFLLNVAVFGYDSGSSQMPADVSSPWTYVLEYYGLKFISLLVIGSLGFMISSAFRSSGLAIGLSIFLLFSGSIVAGLFAMIDKPWVKYVLFPHLDLTAYLNGGSPLHDQETTLGFSIAVLAAYVILFNVVSWTVFRKRDVAA